MQLISIQLFTLSAILLVLAIINLYQSIRNERKKNATNTGYNNRRNRKQE